MSSPTVSPECIASWYEKGVIRHTQRSAQDARIHFYGHLNSLIKPDGPLYKILPGDRGIQESLRKIAKISSERYNPDAFCHKFPIQSFILINQELAKLPDIPEGESMKSIEAIKRAYRDFQEKYVIPEEKSPLFQSYTLDSMRQKSIEPHSVFYQDPHFPRIDPIIEPMSHNSSRWCGWARRACKAFWKKIFSFKTRIFKLPL